MSARKVKGQVAGEDMYTLLAGHADGLTRKEIAARLGVSQRSIRDGIDYLRKVFAEDDTITVVIVPVIDEDGRALNTEPHVVKLVGTYREASPHFDRGIKHVIGCVESAILAAIPLTRGDRRTTDTRNAMRVEGLLETTKAVLEQMRGDAA